MIFINYFLWLISYSFLGWLYESIIRSAGERRLVNSGFLNGPVCPVYGFGALAAIFALYQRTNNVWTLFFAGMLLTCIIEYITAVLLEKLFDAKWWDYSNDRFNIQGRISLRGGVVFGILSVLLIKYIHPFISGLFAQLPNWMLVASASILFFVMMLDLFITVRKLLLLNGQLKEIQSAMNHFVEQYTKKTGELKNTLLVKFEESEYYSDRIKKLFNLNRFQIIRIALAFPKLKFLKYNDAWQKLKNKLMNMN